MMNIGNKPYNFLLLVSLTLPLIEIKDIVISHISCFKHFKIPFILIATSKYLLLDIHLPLDLFKALIKKPMLLYHTLDFKNSLATVFKYLN